MSWYNIGEWLYLFFVASISAMELREETLAMVRRGLEATGPAPASYKGHFAVAAGVLLASFAVPFILDR